MISTLSSSIHTPYFPEVDKRSYSMRYQTYSHNLADSIFSHESITEIQNVIGRVNGNLQTAPDARKAILTQLFRDGWSEEVKIDPNARITITSIKDSVGLCLQFGNMGRFYADLMKLQKLFTKGRIRAAFYILPESAYARDLGSNLANYERLTNELRIFKSIITMPIMVFGVWI